MLKDNFNINKFDNKTKKLSLQLNLERVVTITRTETSNEGTFGILTINNFKCYTGELPWRDNKVGLSCIPSGEYICTSYSSKKYPKAFKINFVNGRTAILIHQGNYCGDKLKGYKSDINGCILLGESIGSLNGQKALLNSKNTLLNFIKYMNNNNFKLVIKDI